MSKQSSETAEMSSGCSGLASMFLIECQIQMITITTTKSIITITKTTSIGVEHPDGSGHPVSPHFGSFRQCRLLCCRILRFFLLIQMNYQLSIIYFGSHVIEMSCLSYNLTFIWWLSNRCLSWFCPHCWLLRKR